MESGRGNATKRVAPPDLLRYKRGRRQAPMRSSNDTALFASGERRLSHAATVVRSATPRRWAIDSPGPRLAKRLLDIAAASVLLVLGAPLCLLVGIAIRLEDGGAALFRQTRVGRGGALFTLYKLRSMRLDAEAECGPQWATPDDARAHARRVRA